MAVTLGRVRGSAVPGQRMFYKPSLRKVIFRPPNVIRTSLNVLKINKKLEDLKDKPEHPARICGAPEGRKPLMLFLSCLSTEMRKIIKPLPVGELRADYAKLVEKKKVQIKQART